MKKQGNKIFGATSARWKERGFIGIVLVYPLLLFAVFYIIVNFNSFLLAFQRVDIDYQYTFNGFENFRQVFSDLVSNSNKTLSYAVRNSFLLFIFVTG